MNSIASIEQHNKNIMNQIHDAVQDKLEMARQLGVILGANQGQS
jgi:hypothetical protein